ncbi:MAG: ATP-dependent RecD-like DNA helicase [Owenweeksia sp. TMED14]|nr:MAG: ATP-dependent RecD-like DNA helicase [Owenweeksia sp. TMED14]
MLPCYLIVNSKTLYNNFRKAFPWEPTQDQEKGLRSLANLIHPEENINLEIDVFILRGYAGTGKTTLVQSIARGAESDGWRSVLGAPTGRAAKVLQGAWGCRAWTLHRLLYVSVRSPDGIFKRIARKNRGQKLIFIIDEASMISDSGENGQILKDLLNFVKSGKNCKLILVGDQAQLPPIGQSYSPALDSQVLLHSYGVKSSGISLHKVMRQSENSGILHCATELRQALFSESSFFPTLKPNKEVLFIKDPQELYETLESCFCNSENDAVIITRSNKRAISYNEQIRSQLLGYEDVLNAGDLVMVVQNNDRWLADNDSSGFIANGDLLEILSWRNEEHKYGLHFADATLSWRDIEAEPFEAKIILDTLRSPFTRLSEAQIKLLNSHLLNESNNLGLSKLSRSDFLKNHPYGQALQLKFGYALTAHKAQGGQWREVFVERPYTDDPSNEEYIRWMYTSFTRAKDKLYLIGFTEATPVDN